MYSQLILKRFFCNSNSLFAAEKSLLATLRKKTGYTFSNCKKALELNNNDLTKAESWLHEQAQALGWSKATKLEGRKTNQGLVAATVQNQNAVLVEINCETDFVARNTNFQEMAEAAARACIEFSKKYALGENPLIKIDLESRQLNELPTADGKLLSDQLALMIGLVGENASLKRGICFKAAEQIHLSVYTHPYGNERNGILLGKFGGVVAFRQIRPSGVDIKKLGKDLCQHIVGMNPDRIGTVFDKPAGNTDDEKCLIYQEFLLDSEWTVGDLLKENGIEIIDFKRFECGETDKRIEEDTPEKITTCQ
ncbi:elongation factor Ts, mitochondrial [Agrilus planipennis]|uniref:Elongation factor Ts, mitochondrial n=1 Tax=Agrilus planipennis TaxID=224129 RepID=A0A1W4X9X0_AGRPL|nr:elongation factor Ts, mitochondrial [Agrilus planipennis]